MNYYFVDTNALIDGANELFSRTDSTIVVSNITLKELENIKQSFNKDQSVKYQARIAANLLKRKTFTLIPYKEEYMSLSLPNDDDGRIVACASYAYKNLICKEDSFIFVTSDVDCGNLARSEGIPIEWYSDGNNDFYSGYQTIELDNNQLAKFYNDYLQNNENIMNLLENEYLLIKDNNTKEICSCYCWRNGKYDEVKYPNINSVHFGKLRPYNNDPYQLIALDSFIHNEITLIGGPAGSGKTYLSLAYLMYLLEMNKINKIVIFCNPVVARNAAKLGYLPGTQIEKIKGSQVGAVLSSKFGDECELDRLISKGDIVLMPAGDSRGYEVPPNSGVYILEAQNLDVVLLRMLLQRIGENCVTIVDGDRVEQTDLAVYSGANNGMSKMSEIFRGEKCFGQVDLKNIYRSKIAKIADKMR